MGQFFSFLETNKKSFLFALGIGILYSAVSVSIPTFSGQLITSVVSNYSNWIWPLIAFLVVSLLQIGFCEWNEYVGNTFKIRQKNLMRKKAFRAFSKNDDIGREEIASFVSFLNNDIPSVAEQYFIGTIDIVNCSCMILFSAFSLLCIHWVLALIILSISVMIVLLPNRMRQKGGAARKAYSSALAQYNTTVQSVLDGLRVVKAYRCHAYVNGTMDKVGLKVMNHERLLLRQQLIVQLITTCLQVAKTAFILIVGVALVSRQQISIGDLVAAIQLAEVIAAPIEVLAYLRHSKHEVLPLLKQYEEMILHISEDSSARTLTSGEPAQISLQHVSYQTGDLTILRDICAQFTAGGKYLITGESGSGKSTLLRLLAQIGDLHYDGGIFCNGEEIRRLSFDSYYEKLCPVFQEPYLFYASLEDNICLGRPIPKEVYTDVVNKLHLSYLLDRYQSEPLSPERVQNLSGGERQRVALARAMVGKPSVYLLDEVTSALDPNNAEWVEQLLLDQVAMVIHVCHKPNDSCLSRYDRKYVLAHGRLLQVESL